MNKSKIVMAAIAITSLCGVVACKRSDSPPDNVNVPEASTSVVNAAPVKDKSPQYVKDLRNDMEKARDAGAVEKKAAEDREKIVNDATK